MEGLTEGRMVHYVLASWDVGSDGQPTYCAGQHRPGVIVRVWSQDIPKPLVNLQVFTDSHATQTGNDNLDPVYWKTSVEYDPEGNPGTWHWMERA